MDEIRLLREEEVKRFEKYLKEMERAPATISKYLHDIRSFMLYRLGQNPHSCAEPLSKEDALGFKAFLIRDYQPQSVNSMLAALNSFFSCMGWSDLRVKLMRIQRQMFCEEEKELSREEYYRLVNTAGKCGKERLSLAIQTLCGLGLRISELKAVTAKAVRAGRIRIWNKGKNRTVFMGKKLQKQLLGYMKKRRIKAGEVFTTRSGKGINRSNLWREMKALCEKAEVSWGKIFPHNLRHLFARTFYAAQKDVVRLADIMGHSSIETTRIYTAASVRECRRKIEALGLVL